MGECMRIYMNILLHLIAIPHKFPPFSFIMRVLLLDIHSHIGDIHASMRTMHIPRYDSTWCLKPSKGCNATAAIVQADNGGVVVAAALATTKRKTKLGKFHRFTNASQLFHMKIFAIHCGIWNVSRKFSKAFYWSPSTWIFFFCASS